MRRRAAVGLPVLLFNALDRSMPREAVSAAAAPGSLDGEPGPAPGPEPGVDPHPEEPEDTLQLDVRPDPSHSKAGDARWKLFLRIPAAPADGDGEEGSVLVGAYYQDVEDSPTLYAVTALRDYPYSSWPEEARPVGRHRGDVLAKALKTKSIFQTW